MNNTVTNQLDGKGTGSKGPSIFGFKSLIIMIVLGVFSFSAYFALSGFAEDLKSTDNGGEHALSKSAVGFGGIMHILRNNGYDVSVSRNPDVQSSDYDRLKVISIPERAFPVIFEEMDISQPTLVILPKWNVTRYPKHKGWVQKQNTPFPEIVNAKRLERMLEEIFGEVSIWRTAKDNQRVRVKAKTDTGFDGILTLFNFENLQTISGTDLYSVFEAEEGMVLARVIGTDTFILSDPDLMNTRGVANRDVADFAVSALKQIQSDTNTYGFTFDLSMHGFSGSQNFIKLALTPPFLGVTLVLLAMLALIGWQAFSRFGDPEKQERVYAYGKRSLIDTSSKFIDQSGRTFAMADDYAELSKKCVLDHYDIPKTLRTAEIDDRLARIKNRTDAQIKFAEIRAQTKAVRNNADLSKLAKTIYNWRGDMTNERK